jgi:hypothetical protein
MSQPYVGIPRIWRSRRSVVASLVIGFLGWFSPVLAHVIPGTLVLTAVIGPIATGALGAAIGRGRGLPWLLLGFLLPPAIAVIVASSSRAEGSGFAFVDYTMLGLVLICLGFFGWVGGHRIWVSRRKASRDSE